MALDSKNNIKSVFIVPDLSYATPGTKMFPGTVTGKVAICDVNNVVLDNTTVVGVNTIKIIKDRGADLPLQQVRLNLADVKTYTGVIGQAATEQSSYIGYDGVNTASISGYTGTLSNTFYIVKLEHVPNAFAYGKRPANYKYGTYQSGAGATEAEVANGLQASLIQNFKPNRTIDWRVITELLCDNGGTSITGPTTYGVARYSKTVTIDAAITSTALVAGDFIRFGTALTDVVYKVAAVSATTITLANAYQGETASLTTITAERISAANAGTAKFGIKITGLKQKYDVNRWRQYDKVRFNVFLENFGAATTVTNDAAFDGIGVYEQAANDEYISWGDEGQVFVDQVPPLFREQDAQVGTQYNPAVLSWVNNLPSLIGAGENKGQAIFYVEDYLAAQGLNLTNYIDAWIAQNSSATLTWS